MTARCAEIEVDSLALLRSINVVLLQPQTPGYLFKQPSLPVTHIIHVGYQPPTLQVLHSADLNNSSSSDDDLALPRKLSETLLISVTARWLKWASVSEK
jgi:hypothetical protein